MKRMKWMVSLLCSSVVFAGAAAFAACGDEEHTHTWTWKSDETQHWQICEADSTEKEGSRGAHADTDNNGKCDTCDRTMPPAGGEHTHAWTWKSDDDEHWQICEADSTEREGSRGAHADTDNNGKCDTCDRAMEPAPTEDLFPAGYLGTWAPEDIPIKLEIASDGMKYNGEEVTVTKNVDATKGAYSFAGAVDGVPFDFAFSLTSDGYAILLTLTGEEGEDTITLIEKDYAAPDFISTPASYTGTWTSADAGFSLNFSEGEAFFGNAPVTILSLNAEGTYATAFAEVESMLCWVEIRFDGTSITVKAPGVIGSFTFTQAEETIEFPSELRANWVEYGKQGGHILDIATHSIKFDGADVTDTAAYNEDEAKYHFLAADDTEYSFALTQDGNVLYMQEVQDGAEETYILFGTVDDEGESELPDLALKDFANKTYVADTASTVGDLVFDANGKGTLGGKAIRILQKEAETVGDGFNPTVKTTGFVFLCDGMWYRASVEDVITLTDLSNKTYKFDGESLTDLSEYAGEWKQFQPYKTATISITNTEFKYMGVAKQCFKGVDGSAYYRDGAWRTPFGFLDEEKTIMYVKMTAMWFFNKTGETPTVQNIPQAFRGEWTSDNFYGLTIDASSIVVNGKAYTPFAVTGEEGEEIVHVINDNNIYVIFSMGKDAAGNNVVLMGDGSMTLATFVAVKPESLPDTYWGNWTQLGGTATVSVDNAGKFTYNGKVYATTVDAHDGSYHFTAEDGSVSTLEVSSDGYVLWIKSANGTVSYFTKVALTELPDLTLSAFKDTAWDNTEMGTITFDAEGKATIGGKKVQILTQEADNADTIGTLIYNNVWYDFRISGAMITLTGASGEMTFTKHGVQIAFAAPEGMVATWNQITGSATSTNMQVVINTDSVSVAGESLTDLSAAGNTITGKQAGSSCTIKLMDDNVIYVAISGTAIYFAKEGTSSLALTAIKGTNWTEATLGTFAVDASGAAKLGTAAVYISTVEMGGTLGDVFAGFTVITADAYYKVDVGTDQLIFTDSANKKYTFAAQAALKEFPAAFRHTWTQAGGDGSITIEITEDSIQYRGTDVTESKQIGSVDAFTFQYQNKMYSARITEDENCLCVKAAGETKSTVFLEEGLDLNGSLTFAPRNTSWISPNMGELAFDRNKNVTIGGKAVQIIGCEADADGNELASMTILYEGMWYHCVVNGRTMSVTDADGNMFTFTRA